MTYTEDRIEALEELVEDAVSLAETYEANIKALKRTLKMQDKMIKDAACLIIEQRGYIRDITAPTEGFKY